MGELSPAEPSDAPEVGQKQLAVTGPAKVKVTKTKSRRTPKFFGVGVSQNFSERAFSFLRYANVNSARSWSNKTCVEEDPHPVPENFDIDRWGFMQGRKSLVDQIRANPQAFAASAASAVISYAIGDNGTEIVDWEDVRAGYDGEFCKYGDRELSYGNFDNPDFLASDRRIYPLIVTQAGAFKLDHPDTTGSGYGGIYVDDAPHWRQRWALWRHHFIQAYYLARKHGYGRFEFYNEPEASLEKLYGTEGKKCSDLTAAQRAEHQQAFLERMVLAGDALQHGIAEANTWRAANGLSGVEAQIHTSAFMAGRPSYNNIEDDGQESEGACWKYGQAAIDYWKGEPTSLYGYTAGGGASWTFPTPFQAYSYHRYQWGDRSDNPEASHSSQFAFLKEAIMDDLPDDPMPIVVSEANLSTGRNAGSEAGQMNWGIVGQDRIVNATEMARLLREYLVLSADGSARSLDGLYLHKFENLTPDDDIPGTTEAQDEAAHGLFWYRDGTVGGVTRAGAVAALFGKGFTRPAAKTGAGPAGLQLYSLDLSNNGDPAFSFAAAEDDDRNRLNILSINSHCAPDRDDPLVCADPPEAACRERNLDCDTANGETDAHDVEIDLSPWAVPSGRYAVVEQVSDSRYGSVSDVLQVNSSGKISFQQRAQSVALITVLLDAGATTTKVASLDATIWGGDHRNQNWGSSLNLTVSAHPTDPDLRKAVVLKMPFNSADRSSMKLAMLRVTGRSGSETVGASDQAPIHVYGLANAGTSFTEANITWNTTPNLDSAGGADTSVNTVGKNVIRRVGESTGESAHFLGVINGGKSAVRTERLDVTDFIRTRPTGATSAVFLFVREVRHRDDADPNDGSATYWMASKEKTAADANDAPALEFIRN